MKIVSRESAGDQPVYDIGVAATSEHLHNYVLENGLVASNCFNKAHSISYSMLTYISAYLKTHYLKIWRPSKIWSAGESGMPWEIMQFKVYFPRATSYLKNP